MHARLYTTEGCHLCELALSLIAQVNLSAALTVDEIEIGDDESLSERYGIRIPVLAFDNGIELNWPFTAEQILETMRL